MTNLSIKNMWLRYLSLPIIGVPFTLIAICAIWLVPRWQVASITEVINQLRSSPYQEQGTLPETLIKPTQEKTEVQESPIETQKTLVEIRKAHIEIENSSREIMLHLVGGSFLILTTYCSYKTLKSTTNKEIADRFSKAVEQLGETQKVHVILGGIYALERIARDSAVDHWTVMEVLAAFVRNTSTQVDRTPEMNIAIQSAITVIGRRDLKRDPHNYKIDLRGSLLSNLDLSGVNLSQANLREAKLSEVILREANLSQTDFRGAELFQVSLYKANLTEAKLSVAKLDKLTNLEEAILSRADLSGSTLKNVKFRETIFTKANLFEARLIQGDKLCPDQVKVATNWEKAFYDKDFCDKLDLAHSQSSSS